MGIFNTFHYLINHPLCKNSKLEALSRWFCWQIGSRLVPGEVAIKFVDDSKLLVKPGMTGATGNIYYGLHEFEDMSFLLHLLRKDDLFVDIGANIGSYTILAAAVRGAQCIAIEPIPATFRYLQQNINLNGINHLVKVYNMGFGKKQGKLRFSADLDTMNHVVPENDVVPVHTIEVEVTTLDSALEGLSPTLIKIDVEGFESNVISGSQQTLFTETVSAVIMELNGSGKRYGFDDDALLKKMQDYGFRSFTYLPFERRLLSLEGKNAKSGNTLFIKNVKQVEQRLVEAPMFHVLGNDI
jgi:FkbM family methyltransferase